MFNLCSNAAITFTYTIYGSGVVDLYMSGTSLRASWYYLDGSISASAVYVKVAISYGGITIKTLTTNTFGVSIILDCTGNVITPSSFQITSTMYFSLSYVIYTFPAFTTSKSYCPITTITFVGGTDMTYYVLHSVANPRFVI